MVKTGKLCRNMVNDYTGRIIRIFAWGVEEELVKPDTVAALREVKSLPKGEPGTFDNPPRADVALDVIKRTLPFMPPVLRAMVMLQLLTGMRPSEVYRMTAGDIDRTRNNGLWYYIPKSHKTEKYIGQKPIPLGKPEQELLAHYLEGKSPESAVFSPRTAMQEHRNRQRTERKSKLTPSQQERDRHNAEKPINKVGEFYNKNS